MNAFSASARTERVAIERATSVRDGYGETAETWAAAFEAYASVRNGTGEERRRAAQEGGSQAATFGLAFSSQAAGITLRDRLQYAGSAWDITSVVIEPRNAGVVVTAVRAT